MHPLLSLLTHRRGLAAYAGAWALAGLCLGALLQQLSPGTGWPRAMLLALPLACAVGVAALALQPVCRSAPLRPARWLSALGRRAAAVGLLALGVAGAAALWNATGALWGRPVLVTLASAQWWALSVALVAVLAAAAAVHDVLLAQHAQQAATRAEAQARLLAREMELKALRAQLDPHFLFNSLNAISALIHADPAAARAMTLDLAQFFRLTLALGQQPRIRLAQELALLQHHLAIQQRRLGGALTLQLEADDACRQVWLPPLLLQPLVENAIKHGIRGLPDAAGGGTVTVQARRDGPRLRLQVANPVDPAAEPDHSGLGQSLAQLQARLQAAYDEPVRADIQRQPGRFTVTLTLPWQT